MKAGPVIKDSIIRVFEYKELKNQNVKEKNADERKSPVTLPEDFINVRWVTQVYGIGILSGLFVKAFMPIVTSNSSWNLPMEAWYPYDVDNPRNYFLSYIQQVIGGVPLMCLHIGIDSLFVGLVLRICTQLELLKNRLQCISKYSTLNTISKAVVKIDLQQWDNLLTDCVCKHANILRSGKRINEEFYGILTGQIIATIPNVCINIYLLSQQKSGITFRSIDLFICFATCLMQIFLYCWYGNKIILHSLDISNAAYDVNWPSLDTVSKKKLLIVMVRSTQSIKVSTGSFIMNNKSFIEILKTSYSAFRVLQRTS